MTSFQELRENLNQPQNRQHAILAAIGLVIVAAGVFFFWPGGSSGMSGKGREVLYVCRSCGNTGRTRISYDEKFPIRCPMCGKKTAMLGFTCNGCGAIYEDTQAAYFKCPKCGYVYGTPPASAPASQPAKPANAPAVPRRGAGQ